MQYDRQALSSLSHPGGILCKETLEMKSLPAIALAVFALPVCSELNMGGPDIQDPETLVANILWPVPQKEVQQIEADLHRHIAILASDEFEGRAPATPGEEKTVRYLQQEFEKLGLKPGNNGDWFQRVPVTSVTTNDDVQLALQGSDYDVSLAYGTQMMVSTQQQVSETKIEDSDLVFAGYGIVAPERNWNDYAGIDVQGKTVVVLVNDPGYATQDSRLFNGNTMTYYGRWTYKYEEGAHQGAAAVLIVHETGAAGYPWEVVSGSWSGPQIGLSADNHHTDKIAVEGWITLEAAKSLFTAAGTDYETMKAAAAKPGFKAVALGDIKASAILRNKVENSQSRNLVARIVGQSNPDEHIIYTSHWDHLGIKPDVKGDNIYNGASDNASGTAGLLAIAQLFAKRSEKPDRSLLFIALTAEESGLLGSRWYSENPIYPLHSTIANLNMDNIAAGQVGLTRDVAVVGFGNSELENYLQDAAARQGRLLVQEPSPEKGFYYRSDHFNFARKGVPALYLTGSTDSLKHGNAWGIKRLQDYSANDYHKPSDEYSPHWDLSGAVAEVLMLYEIGVKLATSDDYPNWHEGNEFKAARDASADLRLR
jgi:Zn-dependent M28 family amino/carboxypeptidase